jgi:hypothetical protein
MRLTLLTLSISHSADSMHGPAEKHRVKSIETEAT